MYQESRKLALTNCACVLVRFTQVKRTQEELLQQKDINRTLGMQTQTLSMEKKSLENTMDAQLKKTSEITLHFKSAELLAVEM